MDSINNGGGCCMNRKGVSKRSNLKLDTYDWLCDVPGQSEATDLVEVTFKNTRKGYYRNTTGIALEKGDVVAVEASPGHDIGTVSLLGPLVLLQMKKYRVDPARAEIKRIYRIAKPNDLEKYEEVKALEQDTMIRSRQIAENLNLNMKIGDVEYQGDGGKAIFYYIADERVDFRQLIKVLADTFHVRIEMKQIGARQEAGRIGGIGPCGRPLCCSSWMSNFVSVSTAAARYQDISPNPQKLAGQCAKLKCCMNYEVDTYLEAQKDFPPRNIQLEAMDGTYYHFKSDILARTMQYSTAPNMAVGLVTLTTERVHEIIAINKRGEKVDSLVEGGNQASREKVVDYENVVGQDSLTRFDKKKRKKNRNQNKGNAQAEGATQDDTQSVDQQPEGSGESQAQSAEGNQQRREGRGDRHRDRDRRKDRDRAKQNAESSAPQQPQSEGNAETQAQSAEGNQQRREGRGDRHHNRNRNRNRNNPNYKNQQGGGESNGGSDNAQ